MWAGPTWWVIGNEMADKYAGWGAEQGALDPTVMADQQITDHITVAAQNGQQQTLTMRLQERRRRGGSRRRRELWQRSRGAIFENCIQDGGAYGVEADQKEKGQGIEAWLRDTGEFTG